MKILHSKDERKYLRRSLEVSISMPTSISSPISKTLVDTAYRLNQWQYHLRTLTLARQGAPTYLPEAPIIHFKFLSTENGISKPLDRRISSSLLHC
jgi:hypothetical protein